MNLASHLESLLFISSKPLSTKRMASLCSASLHDVREALEELRTIYDGKERGIVLVVHNDSAQFSTHPAYAESICSYIQEDILGELTRPALETLAVVAYRGPVTKVELEFIRGVNCSLILRNLLIRGLIEVKEEKEIAEEKKYILSFAFLNHLGIQTVSGLPNYEAIKNDERLEMLFSQTSAHQGTVIK